MVVFGMGTLGSAMAASITVPGEAQFGETEHPKGEGELSLEAPQGLERCF